jgi:hypothetical protein
MPNYFENYETDCSKGGYETKQSYAKGSQKQTWWQRIYVRFKNNF